jgi:(p)ppGpp synthase/HD superfamily hydrolase
MYPEKFVLIENTEKIEFKSDRMRAAYDLAVKSHEGQYRNSGEPYINHCVEVFKILRDEWKIEDEDYLIAALLHDTVEDTNITLQKIKTEFGDQVTEFVDGVTKLQTKNDIETLKKVLNKTYLNPGVAIIKLADRLHNMRTLEFMKPEKQIEKASETLDVYTKLAESLGMWEVKTELEDLCFKYLEPEKYKQTLLELKSDSRLSTDFVGHMKSRIEQLLIENKIDSEVETRKSGSWILIKKQEKMALTGKSSPNTFKDINDVISFRVKTNSVNDCYRVLEKVHNEFGEMIDYDRFDEFIGANKRINGYQALQTTVNSNQGPIEIAIMTKEMEEFNNRGIINLINEGKDLKNYVLKLVLLPLEA